MIDDDLRTLHIRCGSDIRDKLKIAGFAGDFLEYADPVCEGPVPDVPDLMDVRASYLAGAYGWFKGLTEAQLAAGLRDEDDRLTRAHHYDRVVLWFEHDSYDQLVLARILTRLTETTVPIRLELICIDHHPDIRRFNGLGQLGPSTLAALWPTRAPVTPDQLALGQAIWSALRQPDPTALQTIARTGTPALPIASRALWRHLSELPGVADGLSLTQRIVLTLLARGPQRIGHVFTAMVNGLEPLVWLGDMGVLGTIEKMALTDPPVLTIELGEKPFSREASITVTGEQVLAGTTDYLSLAPVERWVGGVRIAAGQPDWRFDEGTGRVVP
jgi:hypothetical protein